MTTQPGGVPGAAADLPPREAAGPPQLTSGSLAPDPWSRQARDPFPQELAVQVAATTGLPEPTARRVVADVTAYFGETVQEYVRRRHEELRRMQWKNDDIWPVIEAELASRRFAAPDLSERQLRRLVYG